LNEITIRGKKHLEAKAWLIERLPELEKLNFPSDWREAVTNYLKGKQFQSYKMQSTDKAW
jgi:hypothetical protein